VNPGYIRALLPKAPAEPAGHRGGIDDGR
jgi:hypothetical protein